MCVVLCLGWGVRIAENNAVLLSQTGMITESLLHIIPDLLTSAYRCYPQSTAGVGCVCRDACSFPSVAVCVCVADVAAL